MARRSKTMTTRLQRFDPVIHIPTVKVPQPDGSLVIRPGKPEVLKGEDEITVARFAGETGISERYTLTLIEQGLVQARPLSPKKNSRWRIPRSEVARYLKLEKP